MQKLKMFSLISIALLLTWCTTTKINQSDEIIDENTGEVATQATDSGELLDETITDTEVTTGTEIGEDATIEVSTEDAAENTEEENALKEKIRVLIEQRKIESKDADKLTEEDIQLMEDVLETIVEETSGQ